MNTNGFFESYFHNAQVNSMLIIEADGTIMRINQSFADNFAYTKEAIVGRNFSLLFNEEDRANGKPQQELDEVLNTGQTEDENYIIDGNGHAVWCAGESIRVFDGNQQPYIVKDIINLQAKRQLQLFLQDTAHVLESIFESSRHLPMMILDGSLKIERVNAPFLELFNMTEAPVAGSRMSQLDHPFWQTDQIKQEVSDLLITQEPFRSRQVTIDRVPGVKRLIRLDSKIIDRPNGEGKKIFLLLETVSD